MDYEALKRAIIESESLEALKKSGNMPPIPNTDNDKNFIFICYSHKDYKAVYCDLLDLHKSRVRCCYDYRLTAGIAWDDDVKKILEKPNCAGVIFYLSENFVLSISILEEVKYVCGDGDKPRKNYFAINLSEEKNPEDLIAMTLGSKRKSELNALGINDKRLHEDVLITAFPEKKTYISRPADSGKAYISNVLRDIKRHFNVTADSTPIIDDNEVKELQEKLDFANTFAIKDGVLIKYLGSDEKVVIPDWVEVIGERAFEDCKFIKEVIIPNGVTSIGDWAFYGCSSLTSITIPGSVTSIGYDAFSGCSSLTSITIGNSVTSIVNSAFWNCSDSLESITVADDNSVYHSAGNCLIKTASKTLILGCKTSIIPTDGSVTNIGYMAFADCDSLTSVTIPDNVTSIGDNAFAYCSSLTSVTIGDSVTSIGDSAFYCCSSLTSVTIGDSVTSIGDSAFYCCRSLTSITIPDSVTSIGDATFSGCNSLTSITIQDSVTSIGDWAFSGCNSLTSITMPDSVTSIGRYAFRDCTSLTSVTIPDGVTSIGKGVFFHCSNLTSVTIPDSVTSIGDDAFCDCTTLTDIHYLGTIAEWNSINKRKNWDLNTPAYTVHCKDGNITK